MFWIPVFIRYFGWPPEHLEDPEWDLLLHQLKGLRLLNKMLGRSPYWIKNRTGSYQAAWIP